MNIQKNTAAIIIIGDEILAGRFQDQNSPFLIHQLSSQGVQVKYCITIPDNSEVIAETILQYSRCVTWVFTSGGIGPTPDDITVESIAKAFDTPLFIHPQLKKSLIKRYGTQCTDEHLRMARVPHGALLVPTSIPKIQIIQFRNIYLFPGVPEFLKKMFLLIKDRFQGTINYVLEINLLVDEADITKSLRETLDHFPGVKIGSYPSFLAEISRVRLILEHENEEYLGKADRYLREKIGQYIQAD